jgi:hypothetical protein
MRDRRRWATVALFAVAMAWMEAATVVYLRRLVGRLDPYQPHPLPLETSLAQAEVLREAATMVMLAAVGWLAGRNGRTRFAYWAVAFGLWDLFYYVFLAVIGPWPRSVWDWDVLFLIPLPWWGPVLAPAAIAALMAAGGTLVSQHDAPQRPVWPGRHSWRAAYTGATLALYVFMADAIAIASGGVEALSKLLPTSFNWPLFLVALTLMAVPILDLASQVRPRGRPWEALAGRSAE